MTDWIATIDDLTYKLECAQFRIEELERVVGLDYACPLALRLSRNQARMLGLLMHKKVASKDALYTALYTDVICDKELPESKVIDVQISHMRRKLRPFGIEIETIWGTGYALAPEAKEKINRMVEQETGRAAA